jgi:superfamily II DNA or RNA helicase
MIDICLRKIGMSVTGFPSFALSTLDLQFAKADPKAYMLKARMKHLQHWDGMKRYYEEIGNELVFRRGFLPRLEKFLKSNDIEYQIKDEMGEYEPPTFYNFIESEGFEFDKIQVQAGKAMISDRVTAIELAVSSGKTEIFMNAACCYLAHHRKSRMLIVVPSRNLMRQTFDRIKDRIPSLNGSVGMFGDNEKPEDSHRIIVSTIASAIKYLEHPIIRNVDGIIIDEAHRSKTNSVKSLIDHINWKVIWACSGKLTYLDDAIAAMDIEAILGSPVYRGSVKSRHSPVKVVLHSVGKPMTSKEIKLHPSVRDGVGCVFKDDKGNSHLGVYRSVKNDGTVDDDLCDEDGKKDGNLFGIWHEDRSSKVDPQPDPEDTIYFTYPDIGIVENKDRNDWAISMMSGFEDKNEPYLVTVARLRHAKKVYRKAISRGLRVAIVSGESSGKEQAENIRRLVTGEVLGIVAVYSTMSEGVDVPNLVHLLKLDGIASEQVLTQQLGRVRRKCDGKDTGYLHIPSDRYYPYLNKKSAYMAQYYQRVGETIELA